MDVAVLGATGEVGRVLLEVLAEREFPVSNLYPLASSRSVGTMLPCGDQEWAVEDAASFDFSRVQLAFFSAGAALSEKYVPAALAAGVTVIDNTSHFRMHKDVPLVVPEVNADVLLEHELPLVVPCPNCSTIQLVIALAPLSDLGLERVDVVTFQAVSGAGHRAVEELSRHSAEILSGQVPESDVFERTIAFNVLPRIGNLDGHGYSGEENKMVEETRKILGLPSLIINPTCVRVPVFYGHSEAVRVQFAQKVTLKEVRERLIAGEGVEVMDDPATQMFPTPLDNGAGIDNVLVGRIRQADRAPEDSEQPGYAVNLWVVADNVRKGAAVNSVQIAERLRDRME